MSVPKPGGGWRTGAILLVQLSVVSAWLWPIGLGGRMPVGGDVTQFSMGLMAELSRALRAWRLPLWNELWGYGFPGVGESQMGVFYPPHWLLYGWLRPEVAYAWSLVLHTLWGSLGVAWAARRFGISDVGAALAGVSWSTCGFFLIHLSHQWGYTTGCWMPWAWGLAWSVVRGDGARRDPFLLAVVLSVQLLPGHFQLAFTTEVGVLVLIAWQLVERTRDRTPGFGGIVRAKLALATAFPLAAAQLWPTLRLARMASSRRDFEYLSGFAVSPLHLVTFFAPGLFERSPLWRMVVWDPFHTSPEEYLGYVGLVPLFLAFGALITGVRSSPAVRALAALAGVTLFFAFGPYAPGFETLCQVPGFSFFRAPARWTMGTSLALALLAGIGYDRLPQWRRPGRGMIAFALFATLTTALALFAIEGWLAAYTRPGFEMLKGGYTAVSNVLPWHEPGVFRDAAFDALKGLGDPRIEDPRIAETWARQGHHRPAFTRPSFAAERLAIYREELTGSALLLAAFVASAGLAYRVQWLRTALLLLTAVDLIAAGRHRRVDVGPIATLASQSPVMARLGRAPGGTRTAESLKNMPMVAGVGPISAYRTLDLPALVSVTEMATIGPGCVPDPTEVLRAIRLTGVGLVILDPPDISVMRMIRSKWDGVRQLETIDDPTLAGWLMGRDLIENRRAEGIGPIYTVSEFALWNVPGPQARGWLVPSDSGAKRSAILGGWSGQESDVIAALKDAVAVEARRPDPEHREYTVHAEGPALLVLNELYDPEWHATWIKDGKTRDGELRPAFRGPMGGSGAWQAIAVPGAGDWTLRTVYRGRDVYQGIGISALAWLTFGLAWLRGPNEMGTGTSRTRSQSPFRSGLVGSGRAGMKGTT